MKKIILVTVLVLLLSTTLAFAKEKPNGQPFQAIWDEIARIWEVIDGIEVIPGPPGEQGPPGECSCEVTMDDINGLLVRIEDLENSLGQVCEPECLMGECIETNMCECYNGWMGIDCTIPICEPECVNGVCVAPDACSCDSGWVGPTCEIETLCVEEGETYPVVPGAPQCCIGLTAISIEYPDVGGICIPAVGAGMCTYCGDGNCGLGENICNCPIDCDIT